MSEMSTLKSKMQDSMSARILVGLPDELPKLFEGTGSNRRCEGSR